MQYEIFFKAFIIGLGLIVAIGAQNIFIIKTGLQRKNVFLAASIAALCDTTLIAVGTYFMSILMGSIPGFVSFAKWAGCIFLIYYGVLSIINAASATPKGWGTSEKEMEKSLERRFSGNRGSSVVLPTLAFSLLNPHVYLDTFLVLGNLGSRLPADSRWVFIAGAGSASFFWFYLTGFAAKWASRAFENTLVTRSFDLVVGAAMFAIAYGLAVSESPLLS